jgi:hypothetical protein
LGNECVLRGPVQEERGLQVHSVLEIPILLGHIVDGGTSYEDCGTMHEGCEFPHLPRLSEERVM